MKDNQSALSRTDAERKYMHQNIDYFMEKERRMLCNYEGVEGISAIQRIPKKAYTSQT
jgi:hypothetical protein